MDENLKPFGKKIGVLGGTFDPPHYGHLFMAQCVLDEVGLDGILFIPAGTPPHKKGEKAPQVCSEQRHQMTLLATEDNSCFHVWDYEVKKHGLSYTIETLDVLRKKYPQTSFSFVLGKDAVAEIFTWKNPRDILRNYDIIVVSREGRPDEIIEKIKEEEPKARLFSLAIPALNISSSEIRKRIRDGKKISYLTPPAVENFILKNKIYR